MCEQEVGKNLYQDLLWHSEWDLDGIPIALTIRSLDPSLFVQLIARYSIA